MLRALNTVRPYQWLALVPPGWWPASYLASRASPSAPRSRKYSERAFWSLVADGLVEHNPPVLYRITDYGRAALEVRDGHLREEL